MALDSDERGPWPTGVFRCLDRPISTACCASINRSSIPRSGPPLDQSVEGAWKFGANPLARAGRSRGIHDRNRAAGRLAGPDRLDPPGATDPPGRHRTRGRCAASPGTMTSAEWEQATPPRSEGRLCSALGSESDPTSQAISQRLADLGIFHEPGSRVRSLRRLDLAHHERPVWR